MLLGNTRPDPWHPVDSLASLRLIFFHISFSWTNDLLRDILTDIDLNADEIAPHLQ